MSARPTPGPWVIGNGGYHHGSVFEIRTSDDADWYITGIPWGDDIYDTSIPRCPEAQANARLIVEAGTVYHETQLTPRELADQRAELLAACQAVLAVNDGIEPASTAGDRVAMWSSAFNQMRAAIAKAGAA